mgnify:CR=1 FL=1
MGNEEDTNKAVAAFLDSEGGHIGGGSLGLCLWAKISTGPWMVCTNSIEKVNLLAKSGM